MKQCSPNIFLDRLFFSAYNNRVFADKTLLQDFEVHDIIILAPVAESLQGIENETDIPWNETISNDFIASHILKCSSGLEYGLYGKTKQFTTINGKTVIIKNDFVYTDKGDINRSPYLVYFLDRPLLKSCFDNYNRIPKSLSVSKSFENVISFQQIIKLYPLISQKVKQILTNSLKKLNSLEESNTLNLDNIRQIIENTVISVIKTFKSSRTLSIKDLLKAEKLSEEDINKERDQELMDSIVSMEYIDIHQVGLPIINNEIIDRIYDAVNCFKQLEKKKIPAERLTVLLRTVQLLVNSTSKITKESQRNKNYNGNMFQDASDFLRNNLGGDCLIPMLLLVVIRAKLNNLETNLIYITYFSFLNTRRGEELYALSSLEAVLYHILHQRDKLKEINDCNIILWDSIKSGNMNILDSIFKKQHPSFNSLFFDDVFFKTRISYILNDIYCYKDINGDSAIMLGIKSKNISSIIFLFNQPQFSLEFLLNDRDIEGSTLLMVAIKLEFKEAINVLLQKLKTCSNRKFFDYLTQKDHLGKTVCHYLFHQPYLIYELGPHLSWKSRDKEGQTPLFTLSTMYNHVDYKKMVMNAIETVQLIENNNLNVDDHFDNNGNSLFHVINDSECLFKLLSCKGNINKRNNDGFTPLIYHIKFGRSKLVRILLNDKRTDIGAKDQNGFTAIHFLVQMTLETMNVLTEIVNIEERTSYTGLTALHIAVQQKSLDYIEYLVKNKSADINALNYKGDRPVDIAKDQEIVNMLDGKVARVVRIALEDDSTIKFIIKSGFINDNSKNIMTVIRTVEDFKFLYKCLVFQYSESWVPSLHIDFLDPFIIPSRPSKSILSAFLNCFDNFLQILFQHSVFSTNELLWEFVTVPQLYTHLTVDRPQKKFLDKDKEKYEKLMSIDEINDIDFFFKHTKYSIENMNNAYNHLHKSLCFLESSYLVNGYLFAIERFIDNLVLKTPSLILELIQAVLLTKNILDDFLSAFEQPHVLVRELMFSHKSFRKSVNIDKNALWSLNLLTNTKKKTQQTSAKHVFQTTQTLIKQSAKLQHIHINLLTELADFYNTHIQHIKTALRNFANATLQEERYKRDQLQRALLALRSCSNDLSYNAFASDQV
ncbi:hypothetical protein PMAC_002115 [Pneumocystis sp. 'macacae']|nr:hypothetical protein PMAC_002115 [Pneumocystis sp. 'macacae']